MVNESTRKFAAEKNTNRKHQWIHLPRVHEWNIWPNNRKHDEMPSYHRQWTNQRNIGKSSCQWICPSTKWTSIRKKRHKNALHCSKKSPKRPTSSIWKFLLQLSNPKRGTLKMKNYHGRQKNWLPRRSKNKIQGPDQHIHFFYARSHFWAPRNRHANLSTRSSYTLRIIYPGTKFNLFIVYWDKFFKNIFTVVF